MAGASGDPPPLDNDGPEARALRVATELLANVVDKSTAAVLKNAAETAHAAAETADGSAAFAAAVAKLDRQAAAKKDEAENRRAFEARKKAADRGKGPDPGKYDPKTDYRRSQKPGQSAAGRGLRRLRNAMLRRVRSPKARKAIKTAFKRAGRAVKAGGAAAGAVLGPLVAGLMRLLGPAQVLVAVLGSAASGMELVSKGTQLLAAVFAPILLPVTVLIAAAMLALSDLLWSKVMPSLKGWFTFILQIGVPVMKTLFEIVGLNVKVIQQAIYWQVEMTNTLIRVVNKLGKYLNLGELPELPNVEKPDWSAELPWVGRRKQEEDDRVRAEENTRRDNRATEILAEITAEKGGVQGPDDARVAHERATAERDKRLEERGVGPVTGQRADEVLKAENERRDRRAGEHLAALDQQARAEGRDKMPADSPDSPWNPKNPKNIAAEARRRADAERDARLKDQGVDPRRVPGSGKGGTDPAKPDFKKLLGEVIQTLEMSQGPKASISDLGGVRNTAQLAVFGDPFEKRMEVMMGQVIGLMKQAVGELPGPPEPPDPTRR